MMAWVHSGGGRGSHGGGGGGFEYVFRCLFERVIRYFE